MRLVCHRARGALPLPRAGEDRGGGVTASYTVRMYRVFDAIRPPPQERERWKSSGQLHRLGLEILPQRLEHLLDDALGVETGAGIHRGRRVVIKELVRQ